MGFGWYLIVSTRPTTLDKLRNGDGMAQKTLKSGHKPLVYLAVILPILGSGSVSLVCALVLAYARIKGIPESGVPNLNGILISLPALFLWIPISLLLANLVLFCVVPL